MSQAHQKPTCFLSHSSRDKLAMNALKELLVAKTSGTIDFFLSSDGQSIPFGRNWVATIEQALTGTALMFCFLTPQSVESPWIYFEAGHAYSRKVKVIPVSALGLKFSEVPPPLNLLQGFNLSNHEGLNNLVSILNEHFAVKYPLSFTKNDYDDTFAQTSAGSSDEFAETIEQISMQLPFEPALIETIIEELKRGGHPFYDAEQTITSFGISVLKQNRNYHPVRSDIEFAPRTFDRYLHLIHAVKSKCPTFNCLRIRFKEAYKQVKPFINLTSLLHESEITLSEDKLSFRSLKFNFDTSISSKGTRSWTCLVLTTEGDFQLSDIRVLLTLLFSRGALYSTNPWD